MDHSRLILIKLNGYNNGSSQVFGKDQNKKLNNDTRVSLNGFIRLIALRITRPLGLFGKGPRICRTGEFLIGIQTGL
jgi:hypothetical protein